MHSFSFATAQQILFGAGQARELPTVAAAAGITHALAITGSKPERVSPVLAPLAAADIQHTIFRAGGEPTIELLQQAVVAARAANCDGVIAIGGGSVIDLGKAVAALLRNTGDLFDYLEVIGKAQPLAQPSAPCIALPTTSGTGAEVTRNAVLASPEHKVKVSLRSRTMLPTAAIVDPELTLALPTRPTAWSGMDALTQLIEPFTSARATPFTDALCREAIPRAASALPKAFADGQDLEARSEMALASLFGGLALANAGLGVVHGFAGPLGGMYDAPHGAICAALLPWGVKVNIAHLRRAEDARSQATLTRYAEVARMLTGDNKATPEDAVSFLRELCAELVIPPLGDFGMTAEDAAEAVKKAARSSSMKANPVALSPDELEEAYLGAL